MKVLNYVKKEGSNRIEFIRPKTLLAFFLVTFAFVGILSGCASGTTETEGNNESQSEGNNESQSEGNNDNQNENVLQIAHLNAFSGEPAAWGLMLRNSIDIAVEDINSDGGIKVGDDYYKVEIVDYDHQYDPTVAQTVFRKAVYDDNIKYLLTLGGGIIPVYNDQAQEEKLIHLAAGGGDSFIGPDYPYTWRTYVDIPDNVSVIVEYITQEYPDLQNYAIIQPDDDMGHSIADDSVELAKNAGLNVFDPVFVSRDVTDFYPMLTSMLEKDVDFIDVGVVPDSQKALVVNQARELGFEGTFLMTDSFEYDVVSEVTGAEALEGSISAPSYETMPTDVGKAWEERYIERQGSIQAWTSIIYDGLMLLEAAIEQAGSIDTEKVNEEMDKVSVPGTTGEVKFGGEEVYGSNSMMLIPVNVAEVRDGELVDVYNNLAERWR